ncbi:MAG: HAD family hydrolase [Phycisphaerales bacterium]
MSYKAIIFDLDGTLVNSLEDLAEATNFALHFFGQQPHNLQAFTKMVGDGTRNLISRALPADRQDLIEQVLVKMREKYNEICLDKTLPYNGLKEVLDTLKTKGIKLAVLTNKDQRLAEKIVNHFFPNYFNIIKGPDGAIPLKPAPQTTLQILNELGVKPANAALVGDSNIDIHTARNAGITGIGVNWGFRGEEELKTAGADYTIDEPKALLKLLIMNS